MMMKKLNILFLLMLIGLTAVDMFGQATTGAFIGYITDSSGSYVVGAKVAAINEDNGLTRRVITGKNGEYVISQLPIGNYILTFEAQGFKQSAAKGLTLQLDQKVRVNVMMEVGDIKDSVASFNEEGGGVQLIRSDTAEVGEVIQNNRIVNLPLNGRFFLQLAQLTPGVVENAKGSQGQQLGGLSGPRITVLGARESDNYFTLDGISATDRFFNTLSAPISVDAIQEFKVQSKLYSADAGTMGGAQINIASKSGTNTLHGSVYGFLRNDNLDARNFFDGRAGIQKGEFRQSQFGATVGGPVIQNKLFYFGNYEGFRSAKEQPRLFTVPTDDNRNGILSTPIIDPTTQQPFANNTIPDARINKVARAFLNYIPKANLPGSVNNYVAAPREINDNNQFTIKTNYRKGDKDEFMVRYTFFDIDGYLPYGFVPLASSAVSLPGFGSTVNQRSQNVAIAETHIFNQNLIGEFRAGFNRTTGGQIQENQNINFCGQVGIVGCSANPFDYGLPKIVGAIPNSIGDSTLSVLRSDNDIQAGYNLSWFSGRHNINAGGMYKRIQFNPLRVANRRGQFTFDGQYSKNPFADFLLGLPTRGIGTTGDSRVYLRGNEYAGYLQDDIKLSRRLSINLGLRYEYYSPLSEKYNKLSTIDIENKRLIVASDGGSIYPKNLWVPGIEQRILPAPIVTSEAAGLPRSLVKKDLNNVAPRFGFALDLFGSQRTILRGGYGIYHNHAPFFWHSFAASYVPFSQVLFVFNPPVTPSTPNPMAMDTILGSNTARPNGEALGINYRTPYFQHWSFGIQQAITKDLVIETQYVGSKGTKLNSTDFVIPDASPVPVFLKPVPVPNLGYVGVQSNGANSNYHAGIVRVEKRMSRGLMVMGSYTYSKSIDNDSLGLSVVSSALDQSNNKSLERGLSSFDIRHRAIVSFTYDVPFKSNNSLLNRLLGNWQAGGIITQQSGQPFTVNILADRANVGITNQRSSVIKNPNLPSDQRTPDRWFDTSAFVMQAFGANGNAGRNIVDGPGTNLVDFSLLKNIPFNERHRLQFRTEIFNLFNHTNFEVPNRICNSAPQAAAGTPCTLQGFGQISAARDPRIIQFGLKYLF